MSPNDYRGPIPKPTPETKPFWDAARQHKLVVQRCGDCGQHYFYPRPLCRFCLSRNVSWTEVSGRGTLHTYVISHRPGRMAPIDPPYVVAIVELDEGPRLMSNLVDVDPDPAKIPCDMRVEVVFADLNDEIALPRFRPVNV